jgi:polyisoprenoid-binding protein YceI
MVRAVDKIAGTPRLKVTGNLNVHGETRSVTLEVAVIKIGTNPRTSLPTVGFDAMTTLKRSDFGLGRYVPQVGDVIEMRIICQAVEAKAYAEYLRAHPRN